MKVSIAITNHNQHTTVNKAMKQSILPYEIFVLSDAKPFKSKNKLVIPINNTELKGRCDNRNSVIKAFNKSDSDALIFIDGDTYPKYTNYIENYIKLFEQYDLIFGTREHTDISNIKKPASDLLTANMDELYSKSNLNYTDLHVVSGVVDAWKNASTFNEKLDLMITGMIGWSCNFGFTKKGINKLEKFMYEHYNIADSIFDSTTFSNSWGYEDVAMGIDALYAGLNIYIDENIVVYHKSHERSDGLFDHIKGRHLIMDRYRNLNISTKIKDKVYN